MTSRRLARPIAVAAIAAALLVALAGVASAAAQDAPSTPAFSLATSHIFTTKEKPSLSLTQLDANSSG